MSFMLASSPLASTSPALPTDEASKIRGCLERAPLFASLSPAAIDDLAARAQFRRAAAGSTVASQGEPGDTLYVIASGRVKAVVFGENGREVTLAVLRVGDVFGEVAMFDGKGRAADCVAIEPSQLLCFGREDILRHLGVHPRTAINLLGQMANRLRQADEAITQLALCDVNERLVRRLIALASEEGTDAPEGVLVRRRPTQQELANMVGSCRETISRAFNQLARDGLIIARGRALVVTRELIARGARPTA